MVDYGNISRFPFRKWIELQEIKRQLSRAAAAWESDEEVTSLICSYVSVALGIPIEPELPCLDIISAFYAVDEANAIKIDFPLLRGVEKEQHLPWDYEERTFYFWASLLAKNYGWTLEYVAGLDVDDAIGMIQECLTHGQLEREWEWSTNELAYAYDQNTKSSKFSPLPRPSWMTNLPELSKKVILVPKELLPIGNVVRWKN